MKETNGNNVEELLEVGSFSVLSEVQKQFVLKEMTPQEFDQIRRVMHSTSPLISIAKFNTEPNSDIQNRLHKKLALKSTKTTLIKQLFRYGSSVAALFVLLFLTYTYFLQEPNGTQPNRIVKAKKETKLALPEEKTQSKKKKPLTAEPEVMLIKDEDAVKSTLNKALPKVKEKEAIDLDPEEFITLTSELSIDEVDVDATLAYFSNESERAFHYHTRVE